MRGEDKEVVVRGTRAVGARGQGLCTAEYSELSKGRGVL
jgi:hypothetical protein